MPIKSRHGGSVSTRRIGANSGVPAARLAPAAPTRAHRPSSAVSPARSSRAFAPAPTVPRPPFLPHLRPHRAHGATPHDRPDAPLSPFTRTARTPRIAHAAPSALAALSETARLPAEVLKLQAFSFLQSISNSIVSLLNVREKDVKGLLFRK